MGHRPHPSRERALHQVDRHAYERCPLASAADQFRATILRAYRVPPRLLGVRWPHPRDSHIGVTHRDG